MSTIANYPDGVNTTGPTIANLATHPIEYSPQYYRNEDGGVDVNVKPCGSIRWDLEYEGLTSAEFETLRTHFHLAKRRVNDFSFYSRYDDAIYTRVFYETVSVPPHAKTWAKSLRITLVKYI